MVSVSEIKTRILKNIYKEYSVNLAPCNSLSEMEAPSVRMMQHITDLILPGHTVKFTKNQLTPQEEVKDNFSDNFSTLMKKL